MNSVKNSTRLLEDNIIAPSGTTAQSVSRGDKNKIFQTTAIPNGYGNTDRQIKAKIDTLGSDLRVSHCEFVQDIVFPLAVDFSPVGTPIAVNPGLSSAFPWLSSIAGRYESYKFEKLVFHFRTSTSSENSGFFAMAPDYDPQDSAPLTKAQLFQYESLAHSPLWMNSTLNCRPVDINKRISYFVRRGPLAANQDLSLHDVGNLFFFYGSPFANLGRGGEIWVEYVVKFTTPQVSRSDNVLSMRVASGGGGLTNNLPFGNTPVTTFDGGFPVGSFNSILRTVTFMTDYEGLILLEFSGSGIASINAVGSTVTSSLASTPVITGGGVNLLVAWRVSALRLQTFVFSLVGASAISGAAMRISQYAYNLG